LDADNPALFKEFVGVTDALERVQVGNKGVEGGEAAVGKVPLEIYPELDEAVPVQLEDRVKRLGTTEMGLEHHLYRVVVKITERLGQAPIGTDPGGEIILQPVLEELEPRLRTDAV
jgi:hypothetical protein